MNQQQGRTSSGEEISQPSQIENFGPNVASEKVVVANFKGDYKEATNYYYKEVNKLYFANIVLNNQVPIFPFSSRLSWMRRMPLRPKWLNWK